MHILVHNFCASTSGCLAIVVAWLTVEPVAFYDFVFSTYHGILVIFPHASLGGLAQGEGVVYNDMI